MLGYYGVQIYFVCGLDVVSFGVNFYLVARDEVVIAFLESLLCKSHHLV